MQRVGKQARRLRLFCASAAAQHLLQAPRLQQQQQHARHSSSSSTASEPAAGSCASLDLPEGRLAVCTVPVTDSTQAAQAAQAAWSGLRRALGNQQPPTFLLLTTSFAHDVLHSPVTHVALHLSEARDAEGRAPPLIGEAGGGRWSGMECCCGFDERPCLGRPHLKTPTRPSPYQQAAPRPCGCQEWAVRSTPPPAAAALTTPTPAAALPQRHRVG